MNLLRRSLLLGCATLALAACATKPDVSRIADLDVDFHSYRTFAFLSADRNLSLMDRRLLAAARSQMERRGYAFDELTPDLLVNIAAVVEERHGVRATPGASSLHSTVEPEAYRIGRMVIDLVDARRQQVVWHGSAEGRVSPAMMRDAGTAVEMAVAAVFEGFPIQARMPSPAGAPKPQPTIDASPAFRI